MADQWTPKIGDRVMVGEHGPYEVVMLSDLNNAVMVDFGDWPDEGGPRNYWTRPEWLTPAPKPRPEEPKYPGALVIDASGNYWFRREGDLNYSWFGLRYGQVKHWVELDDPYVIFSHPSEAKTTAFELEMLKVDFDTVCARRQECEQKVEELTAERDALEERLGQTVQWLEHLMNNPVSPRLVINNLKG